MKSLNPCFVANWKMNKTGSESKTYLRDFVKRLEQSSSEQHADVVLAPPFTALSSVSEALNAIQAEIGLAAQNVYFESSGAYTGEISAQMLKAIGCRYVIIGHSERRSLFGESHADIHKKLKAVQDAGLLPILCIGESMQERKSGKTWSILETQLKLGLGYNIPDQDLWGNISDGLIAYEPVWAIGTGEPPIPSEVAAVHQKIGAFFLEYTSHQCPRILYGGSVSEKNIGAFMKEDSIDGVLVGGASLSPESFHKIVQTGAATKARR
ncbi:triose-phosphate isomerase [Nitrospira defluvii]|nr:triose-phosphate isomerase [Nitrospira defluvii]